MNREKRKFRIRATVPSEMKRQLKILAAEEGISVSTLIMKWVKSALADRPGY